MQNGTKRCSESRGFPKSNNAIFGIISFFVFAAAVNLSANEFKLVKDINPGNYSSNISQLSADNAMYFWAEDAYGSVNKQLWTSNGSTAGTRKISDIDHDAYYTFGRDSDMTVGNNYFFSLRRQSDNGYELWKGNSSGISKLKDLPDYIKTGFDHCPPAASGGLYFFVPFSDATYGSELWVSDGTTAGTKMVKDITPGVYSSSISDMMDVGGVLYFRVGRDIWKSDGTRSGTRMVLNFDSGETELVEATNDTLYFMRLLIGTPFDQLWWYKASSGQTSKIVSIDSLSRRQSNYVANGKILYFASYTKDNARRWALWKTNGTAGGTVLLKEWNAHLDNSTHDLTNVGGTIFFKGGDSPDVGELWKSDGTASGTVLVKDINDNPDHSSRLSCLTAYGNTLFFYDVGDYTSDLWMSDGSTAGTKITDFKVNSLKCPALLSKEFYFYGNDTTNTDYRGELYKYDSLKGLFDFLPAINMYLLDN